VTARGVVTLAATNLGLFAPVGEGFVLRELAPGVSIDEVRAVTGSKVIVPG
jgi:acyl CoA:acetate/3-ketoacid CoA transferase beta subunit